MAKLREINAKLKALEEIAKMRELTPSEFEQWDKLESKQNLLRQHREQRGKIQ
jgi:hypothetical protein